MSGFELEGKPPEGPHLAVVTHSSGLSMAMPPGAVIMQILDPKDPRKISRMILTKVSNGRWEFKCGCLDENCTVEIAATIRQVRGSHKR